MSIRSAFAVVLFVCMTAALAQERPLIVAADKAALEAAKGQEVTVEGKIAKAEWSRSGKVCNLTFEDAPHLVAAAFERNREKLDAAFNGDFAATMTGATVRISGKLDAYGGHDPALKDALQMVIAATNNVTVIEPADAPATQP